MNIIKINQDGNNKGAVSFGPLGPYFQSRGQEESLFLQPENFNLVGKCLNGSVQIHFVYVV